MKITLIDEHSLRLDATPGMLTVEAPTEAQAYSPFHAMASGLAMCTFSILESWAHTVKLDVSDLVIQVDWSFVEKPHRVGRYGVHMRWPGLPESRRTQALRVAGLCPVKHTLQHPPEIQIELDGPPALGPGTAAPPESSV